LRHHHHLRLFLFGLMDLVDKLLELFFGAGQDVVDIDLQHLRGRSE
jgi:hypothetical protein